MAAPPLGSSDQGEQPDGSDRASATSGPRRPAAYHAGPAQRPVPGEPAPPGPEAARRPNERPDPVLAPTASSPAPALPAPTPSPTAPPSSSAPVAPSAPELPAPPGAGTEDARAQADARVLAVARAKFGREPQYVPQRAVGPSGPRHRALRFVGRHGFLFVGMALFLSGVGAVAASPSSPLRHPERVDRAVAATPQAPPTSAPRIVENPTIPAPATTTTTAPAAPAPAGPAKPPPDWRPTALKIPEIGVEAPVDPVGVDKENALEVPTDTARVGWWSGGAQPGETGPAVLLGHVDSYKGPAVFFKLANLKPGDVVEVDRADGSPARYMIDHLESHPKTKFPTLSVYGATAGPTLRLITCFGKFDEVARSYKNNLIVYANILP